MAYIDLWKNHEIVLPVLWSQNPIWVSYNFPEKPSVAKIHLKIIDRGVYRFGYRISEPDPLLGFTINVNGYDVYVITPVNPTGEIIIDVKDRVLKGSNTFYAIIWRSAINFVVSFYIVFDLRLEADVEGTLESRSIPVVQPNFLGSLSSFISGFGNMFIQLFMFLILLKLFPYLIDVFADILERGKRKEKD
ncbi:MAG: hypothetical protein QXI09_03485 [Candidatus Aenigmatarchaeota archaeon]